MSSLLIAIALFSSVHTLFFMKTTYPISCLCLLAGLFFASPILAQDEHHAYRDIGWVGGGITINVPTQLLNGRMKLTLPTPADIIGHDVKAKRAIQAFATRYPGYESIVFTNELLAEFDRTQEQTEGFHLFFGQLKNHQFQPMIVHTDIDRDSVELRPRDKKDLTFYHAQYDKAYFWNQGFLIKILGLLDVSKVTDARESDRVIVTRQPVKYTPDNLVSVPLSLSIATLQRFVATISLKLAPRVFMRKPCFWNKATHRWLVVTTGDSPTSTLRDRILANRKRLRGPSPIEGYYFSKGELVDTWKSAGKQPITSFLQLQQDQIFLVCLVKPAVSAAGSLTTAAATVPVQIALLHTNGPGSFQIQPNHIPIRSCPEYCGTSVQ